MSYQGKWIRNPQCLQQMCSGTNMTHKLYREVWCNSTSQRWGTLFLVWFHTGHFMCLLFGFKALYQREPSRSWIDRWGVRSFPVSLSWHGVAKLLIRAQQVCHHTKEVIHLHQSGQRTAREAEDIHKRPRSDQFLIYIQVPCWWNDKAVNSYKQDNSTLSSCIVM